MNGYTPEDPGVLLMEADCVLDDDGAALAVIDHTVKVLDVAQAVTSQGEGVGAETKALQTI